MMNRTSYIHKAGWSQVWWYTPIIQHKKAEAGGSGLHGILSYIASSRQALQKTLSQKTEEYINEQKKNLKILVIHSWILIIPDEKYPEIKSHIIELQLYEIFSLCKSGETKLSEHIGKDRPWTWGAHFLGLLKHPVTREWWWFHSTMNILKPTNFKGRNFRPNVVVH